MTLTLGYSPCPNDTFIFCALANNLIDYEGLDFDIRLHDIEELNRMCREKRLDVTKLSIAAYCEYQHEYGLLRSGGALGRGCGPLIVARQGLDLKDMAGKPVAVPGLMTTAYFLLSLYLGERPLAVPMTFDRVMAAVSDGECGYGVVIHEGRFTYQDYGLVRLLDLGKWWEQRTGAPIPLGGIAIRRELGAHLAEKVDGLINKSLTCALKDPSITHEYVRRHAQEMEEKVIREHIRLYVNDFALNLSGEGEAAITELMRASVSHGLSRPPEIGLFAY
ncbi:MAG: 1,4-dihydroxy-6-naphthoate synthase [Thermodesulfobacteriota bacterium]|nr:1,4-dihydroxy-6-naphthoate synthase [Thermodesulfobacteriota bacterium]